MQHQQVGHSTRDRPLMAFEQNHSHWQKQQKKTCVADDSNESGNNDSGGNALRAGVDSAVKSQTQQQRQEPGAVNKSPNSPAPPPKPENLIARMDEQRMRQTDHSLRRTQSSAGVRSSVRDSVAIWEQANSTRRISSRWEDLYEDVLYKP